VGKDVDPPEPEEKPEEKPAPEPEKKGAKKAAVSPVALIPEKLPAHPDDEDNNNSVPNSCTGS
jgi:hypothetical protein